MCSSRHVLGLVEPHATCHQSGLASLQQLPVRIPAFQELAKKNKVQPDGSEAKGKDTEARSDALNTDSGMAAVVVGSCHVGF